MRSHLTKIFNFIKEKRSETIVFLAFGYYFVARLSLIIRYGDAAFGYDTGIYRYHLESLGAGDMAPFGLGFAAFAKLLAWLGFSVDAIMYGWYLFFATLLFVLLYGVAKLYFNKKVAVWAVVLLALSNVQFVFFWWYYYRNLMAVVFLLAFLWLFYYRSLWAALPLFALGSVHPLSLVPVGLTMIIWLARKPTRTYTFLMGFAVLLFLGILQWPELQSYVWLTVTFAGRAVNALDRAHELTGQFVSWAVFWRLAFAYGILGIVAFTRWRQNQTFLFIFGIINGLLMLAGVLLYRRFFIFIDLILILGAAEMLAWYEERAREWYTRLVLIAFVFILVGLSLQKIISQTPLVTPVELENIKQLRALPSTADIVSYTSHDAPWLYGFSGHQIIAPGLFANNALSRSEWNILWNTTDPKVRYALLAPYRTSDIYIYLGRAKEPAESLFKVDPHAVNMGGGVWRYDL